jgi:hypothetical protein
MRQSIYDQYIPDTKQTSQAVGNDQQIPDLHHKSSELARPTSEHRKSSMANQGSLAFSSVRPNNREFAHKGFKSQSELAIETIE